jgi:hypothetical protein
VIVVARATVRACTGYRKEQEVEGKEEGHLGRHCSQAGKGRHPPHTARQLQLWKCESPSGGRARFIGWPYKDLAQFSYAPIWPSKFTEGNKIGAESTGDGDILRETGRA